MYVSDSLIYKQWNCSSYTYLSMTILLPGR